MPSKMKKKGGGLKVKKAKQYGAKPKAMRYGMKKKKKK